MNSRKNKKCDLKYLFQEFETEYKNTYRGKIAKIKRTYPEITRPGRRTGKVLKNICFFIWYSTEGKMDEIFSSIFKVVMLLWAQDDFYDNPRISHESKQAFHANCKNLFSGKRIKIIKYPEQTKELLSLWREIIGIMQNYRPRVFSYWQETAEQMNNAMNHEEYQSENCKISFNNYMQSAIYSVGAIFIWTTYFILKKVPLGRIKALEDILWRGALISRLSNDIASHAGSKNKINAVSVTHRMIRSSRGLILTLMKKEKKKLNNNLNKLQTEIWIKKVLRRSVEFLIKFYGDSSLSNKL